MKRIIACALAIAALAAALCGGVLAVGEDGWALENGIWFYYQNGERLTGWLDDGGARYYLKPGGDMAAGESLVIDGVTYAFDESGALTDGGAAAATGAAASGAVAAAAETKGPVGLWELVDWIGLPTVILMAGLVILAVILIALIILELGRIRDAREAEQEATRSDAGSSAWEDTRKGGKKRARGEEPVVRTEPPARPAARIAAAPARTEVPSPARPAARTERTEEPIASRGEAREQSLRADGDDWKKELGLDGDWELSWEKDWLASESSGGDGGQGGRHLA